MMTLWAMHAMDSAFMEWQMSQYDHASRMLTTILDENLVQIENQAHDFDRFSCLKSENLPSEFWKKTLDKSADKDVCHRQHGLVLMRYVIEQLNENPCLQVTLFEQGHLNDYSVVHYRITLLGQHQIFSQLTLTLQSVITGLGHQNPACLGKRYFLTLGRQSWRCI